MKRPLLRTLLVACALLGAAPLGCAGPGFQIDTPSGFAELEDQEQYGYRATNAEGVVLAVRREANAPYGDLSFWSGALDAHLRRQGYQATEAVDVTNERGIAGKQIRYQIDRSGRAHAFWMTVFVTDAEVVTVEVGGDEAFFEGAEKQLVHAIKTLEIG